MVKQRTHTFIICTTDRENENKAIAKSGSNISVCSLWGNPTVFLLRRFLGQYCGTPEKWSLSKETLMKRRLCSLKEIAYKYISLKHIDVVRQNRIQKYCNMWFSFLGLKKTWGYRSESFYHWNAGKNQEENTHKSAVTTPSKNFKLLRAFNY